eukprot:SAG22_NODE_6907_length_796_cov_1.114778_2_plen_161_part_01
MVEALLRGPPAGPSMATPGKDELVEAIRKPDVHLDSAGKVLPPGLLPVTQPFGAQSIPYVGSPDSDKAAVATLYYTEKESTMSSRARDLEEMMRLVRSTEAELALPPPPQPAVSTLSSTEKAHHDRPQHLTLTKQQHRTRDLVRMLQLTKSTEAGLGPLPP